MPPTALSSTDDIDKEPVPHKEGMKPPTVEPIIRKIQIIDFEFI